MTQWVWDHSTSRKRRRRRGRGQVEKTKTREQFWARFREEVKTFVFKCCDETNVTSCVLDKLKQTAINHLFSALCCNQVMDPYLVGLQDSLDQRFQHLEILGAFSMLGPQAAFYSERINTFNLTLLSRQFLLQEWPSFTSNMCQLKHSRYGMSVTIF